MRNKIGIFIVESVIFILVAWMAYYFYPKGLYNNIDAKQRIDLQVDNFVCDDFEFIAPNVIKAGNDTPRLFLQLKKVMPVTEVIVSVKEMSTEKIQCRIFYDSSGRNVSGKQWVECEVYAGENLIKLPQGTMIKLIRMDISCREGDIVNVESISLNSEISYEQ